MQASDGFLYIICVGVQPRDWRLAMQRLCGRRVVLQLGLSARVYLPPPAGLAGDLPGGGRGPGASLRGWGAGLRWEAGSYLRNAPVAAVWFDDCTKLSNVYLHP